MTFSNFGIEATPPPKAPDAAPANAPAGSDTTKPTPTAPAADTADELRDTITTTLEADDADDLDFGLGDDTDADDDEGPSGAAAAEADADSQENADEAVGIDTYMPPSVDGVTWNTDALDPIVGVAARHGISEAAMNEALQAYGKQVKDQLAKLADNDTALMKATKATLRNQWGRDYDANRAAVDGTFRTLPKTLQTAIKTARLPDGSRLAALPELAQLLHQVSRNTTPAADTAKEAEIEERARFLMKTDFQRYVSEGWADKLAAITSRRAQKSRGAR